MTTRRLLLVGAIVVALLGFRCADGFRQDELECENAMSALARCCTGFQADQASCDYSSNSCDDTVTYPVFAVSESSCIQHEGCSDLRASGVCDRAQHLPYVPPSASAPEPICP
jgi:hypothetical protein